MTHTEQSAMNGLYLENVRTFEHIEHIFHWIWSLCRKNGTHIFPYFWPDDRSVGGGGGLFWRFDALAIERFIFMWMKCNTLHWRHHQFKFLFDLNAYSTLCYTLRSVANDTKWKSEKFYFFFVGGGGMEYSITFLCRLLRAHHIKRRALNWIFVIGMKVTKGGESDLNWLEIGKRK